MRREDVFAYVTFAAQRSIIRAEILPANALPRRQRHAVAKTIRGRRLHPAAGQNFANLVRAGGEIGELVIAAGIRVLASFVAVEHLVIVQIDINGAATDERFAGVTEAVAVRVVPDLSRD